MKKIEYLDIEQLKKVQNSAMRILLEVDRLCRKHNIKYTIAYGTLLGAVRHNGFIPWDDDIDVVMLKEEYDKFRKVCEDELGEQFFYQTNNTDFDYFRLFDKIRLNGTVFKEIAQSNHDIHHGVFLDIFVADRIPDNLRARKRQARLYSIFQLGISVKYINIEKRSGSKKIAARFLRLIYAPFSLKWLYRMALSSARKYNNFNTSDTRVFEGPYGERDIIPTKYYSEVEDVDFEGHRIMATKYADNVLRIIYGDYMKLPPMEKRKTQHDLIELKL